MFSSLRRQAISGVRAKNTREEPKRTRWSRTDGGVFSTPAPRMAEARGLSGRALTVHGRPGATPAKPPSPLRMADSGRLNPL